MFVCFLSVQKVANVPTERTGNEIIINRNRFSIRHYVFLTDALRKRIEITANRLDFLDPLQLFYT